MRVERGSVVVALALTVVSFLQCAKVAVQGFGAATPKTKLASVVLGTVPSGELLVTQRVSRSRHGSYNGMWVFPGGPPRGYSFCRSYLGLLSVYRCRAVAGVATRVNSASSLVAGKVDIGETPEEGAMREFEEETGLTLIDGSLKAVALWQPQVR